MRLYRPHINTGRKTPPQAEACQADKPGPLTDELITEGIAMEQEQTQRAGAEYRKIVSAAVRGEQFDDGRLRQELRELGVPHSRFEQDVAAAKGGNWHMKR